ncbi:hypothetical protein VKT23_004014 [Stygiomarasmius scandens]|uniref:Uncharacterized protein n=1 Tax=Marasmiellus scandens TaxID=2682957 RepID=A0ABR1JTP6_9AGAR
MIFSTLLSAALLALPLVSHAEPHARPHAHRHRDIAKRAPGHVNIYKRFDSARWTFYDVGMGACGKFNVASDFIVALNSAQYGGGYPGPNCFKSITMQYNGKTTQATIMDECPGCPYGGLDLSRGLFTFFAPESEGVLTGTWWFNDGSGSGGSDPTTSSSEWTPPSTSSTPEWTPPTFTWEPPSTSSTWEEPSTTKTRTHTSTSSSSSSTWSEPSSSSSSWSSSSSSSSWSSSAAPSSSAIDYSSGPASGLAVPTGTASDSDFLYVANQAIINMGAVVAVGIRAD